MRMATDLADQQPRLRLLQCCQTTTAVVSHMETDKTPEHKPDDCIDHPPATARARLLQVLPHTPPQLQLYPVPAL